jgi:hypothetical protein
MLEVLFCLGGYPIKNTLGITYRPNERMQCPLKLTDIASGGSSVEGLHQALIQAATWLSSVGITNLKTSLTNCGA